MSSLLDAALRYAARGWDVFPCHTPDGHGGCSCGQPDCENQGKHPRIAWKANATSNPKTIAAWWKRWPAANIGIATGARSRLVVLDVDGDDGAVTMAARGDPGLGPLVTTGRGQHRYLAHPGFPVKNFVKRDGLDLRGDGGFVVAPPSLHWTSSTYAWDADSEGLALPPMPDWLLAMLAPDPEPERLPIVSAVPTTARSLAYATVALESEIDKLAQCVNGTRNKTLNEVALKLGHIVGAGWLQETTVADVLLATATKIGLPRHEALATIKSGIMAGRKDPSVLEDRPLSNDPAFGLTIKKQATRHEPPGGWLHRGVSASALQIREFEQLNWPVANILSEGCTLLAGKPKSKKSWLALGIAVDVARGQTALGMDTQQGTVLYLDLESNQRRMQSRLRAMLGSDPWPENLHIFTDWPRGEDGIAQLDEWMVLHPDTILVVGDILKNLRPIRVKNANPYDEDYEAVQPFNAWCEHNHVAMIMIHHTRKAKADDVFDEISGSTGLSAGVASMWVLGRLAMGPESVLAIRGRDIVIDDDIALEWDDYGCRFKVTGTASERSVGQERRAILDAMSDTGEYTPKELATMIGKSVSSVNKLLAHLFSDRLVEKSGYGKYMKVMGRQTYGLNVSKVRESREGPEGGETGETGETSGNSAGNSPPLREVSPTLPTQNEGWGELEQGIGMPQTASINGNSPHSPSSLKENEKTTEIDRDKRRELAIDREIAKGDFKAARRSVRDMYGNVERTRMEARIDEAERNSKNNGGYISPAGY